MRFDFNAIIYYKRKDNRLHLNFSLSDDYLKRGEIGSLLLKFTLFGKNNKVIRTRSDYLSVSSGRIYECGYGHCIVFDADEFNVNWSKVLLVSVRYAIVNFMDGSEEDFDEEEIGQNVLLPKAPPAPKVTYKTGCYIATAVYGSYDCPQVWTLRRYRDNSLAKSWYGRLFIYTYYAISPTLVRWFGNTKWFKNMCRRELDYMVRHLQNIGYESTPYVDHIW